MKQKFTTLGCFLLILLFAFNGRAHSQEINLLSPQPGACTANLNPVFKWSASGSGTLTNVLYVDTDLNPFVGGIAYNVEPNQFQKIVTGLAAQETYYWGVIITHDGGNDTSVVQSFSTLNAGQGADFTRGTQIVTSAAPTAQSVYAADVDGDGDMDVLSASGYYGKIEWYQNNGNNQFTALTISTNAGFASSVFAADVDGDGDMDVLSASKYDDKIAWYENNGTAIFSEEHIISTSANGAVCVYAADVDGDGDMDVLSASWYDDKIAWYENDGNQSFTEQVISTNAKLANSVYACDMDGDGDMDVLSASRSDDKVAWYENDGSQSFTTRVITTGADLANCVYAVDLDEDGDMDVLSASGYDDKIAWYENNGSQVFASHTISTSADEAYMVYAADMDGDGDWDIVSASKSDNTIAWYENDGSENFTTHVITNEAYGAMAVYATDMDNDGDVDVLSASRTNGRIDMYENNGQTFHIGSLYLNAPQPEFATADLTPDFAWRGSGMGESNYAIFIGEDLDPYNNGVSDNAGSSQNYTPTTDLIPGTIYYWQVVMTGGFSLQSVVQSFSTLKADQGYDFTKGSTLVSSALDGGTAVFAADIDTDGDMDLLSASSSDDKIAWYENNGAETFTQHVISTEADGAQDVYACDVDGDGDMDVLSASGNDDKIAWYENDGFENFATHIISNAVDYATSIYACDVDGDGDMDVVSSSMDDDLIAWHENDGAQNFSLHIISTTVDGPRSVAAIDMDGDGDMDVVSGSYNDSEIDTIYWFQNDGNEVFTKQVVTNEANGVECIYCVDLDQDGNMDVLSASKLDNKVAWYENNGAQSFTEKVINSMANGANDVYAADMDGDGDLDVLSSSYNDNTLAWYENNGSQSFTKQVLSSTYQGANAIYACDIDSDGDMDVLTSNFTYSTIRWYENGVASVSPNVSFTDGSDYSVTLIPGANSQPFGRFVLSADLVGSDLTSVSIKLNGIRSGFSNFQLWQSSDAVFSSVEDTPIGAAVANDPGEGNTLILADFTSSIGTTETYYFVTCDLTTDATGGIEGVLESNSSLGIKNGALSGTINNASLHSGKALGVDDPQTKVNSYDLAQNYPNPFNPSTTISFTMKKAGLATLKIYDVLGRAVFNETMQASVGANALTFNAKHLTSGIYFYQLQTEGFSKTMKMMLVK